MQIIAKDRMQTVTFVIFADKLVYQKVQKSGKLGNIEKMPCREECEF